MQEINLLQNKVKDQTLSWERRNRLVVTLFTLIVILEVLGGIGLYVLTKTTQSQVASTEQKNQSIQASLNSSQSDLNLAKGLQAQLKNLKSLLNNHVYWSTFYQALAAQTTKKTQYTSLSASTTDGKVTLQGETASYTDLGKLILSLTTSSHNFSDVKLNSVSPSDGQKFGYKFDISLQAATSLFRK